MGRSRSRSDTRRQWRDLRAAHRDLHSRRHAGQRHRASRPSRRARRRFRRTPARQRLQRRIQLGLRRRRLVRRAGELRRSGCVSPLRDRLSPARSWRDPGRCLQPPGSERQRAPPLRPVPGSRRGHYLGGRDRSHPARGAPLHPRQHPHVVRGIRRRRSAAGCRARPGRPDPRAPAAGAGTADRRVVCSPGTSAHPDRRIRSQRSGDDRAA